MKNFFITTMGLACFLAIVALSGQVHAETGACYIRVKYPHINDDMMSDTTQLYCYPDWTKEKCYAYAVKGNFAGWPLIVYVLHWRAGKPCLDL